MPLTHTTRRHHTTTTTTPRRRGGLFARRQPARHHHHAAPATTTTTHAHTTAARGPTPASKPMPRRYGPFKRRRAPGVTVAPHHHKRKPTMKDKVSGALLKLKGSLTHRPGVKAAGTRRMHGTDGRGSHHRY